MPPNPSPLPIAAALCCLTSIAPRIQRHHASKHPNRGSESPTLFPLAAAFGRQSIESLIDTAVEMDTGRYSSLSCDVIYYVIRLVTRVEGYLKFISRHYQWRTSFPERAGPSFAK